MLKADEIVTLVREGRRRQPEQLRVSAASVVDRTWLQPVSPTFGHPTVAAAAARHPRMKLKAPRYDEWVAEQ